MDKDKDNRTQIIVQTSTVFKEAIAVYAQQHNTTVSGIVKLAVAQYIGYDFEHDAASVGRPRKYANDEERKQAQKAKATEQRQLVKLLLEWHAKQQREQDAEYIENSLIKKGVPID